MWVHVIVMHLLISITVMQILLHTMHKYYVQVCIDETCGEDANPHKSATERANHVFTFPETTFIGVTSYLNFFRGNNIIVLILQNLINLYLYS